MSGPAAVALLVTVRPRELAMLRVSSHGNVKLRDVVAEIVRRRPDRSLVDRA